MVTRKWGIALCATLMMIVMSSDAQAASKRELYQIHCGIAKESVTSAMKKLSRREIIAKCAGSEIQAQSTPAGSPVHVAGNGHASLASRSDTSGRTRRIRISGGSMAHVGIQDGSTVRVVARTPHIGDHVVFSGAKCGGSGCLKTLRSVNANGCIWVTGRPGRWGNGHYSVDSSRYGWICDYRISGVVS